MANILRRVESTSMAALRLVIKTAKGNITAATIEARET
jgi:hypothetical protein